MDLGIIGTKYFNAHAGFAATGNQRPAQHAWHCQRKLEMAVYLEAVKGKTPEVFEGDY
jgi:hypothetical protein